MTLMGWLLRRLPGRPGQDVEPGHRQAGSRLEGARRRTHRTGLGAAQGAGRLSLLGAGALAAAARRLTREKLP